MLLSLVGGLSWLLGPTVESWVWCVRCACLLGILVPPFVLIWIARQKDKVPDFLRSVRQDYFERDGFCFAASLEVINDTCHVVLHYQNRYERRCQAEVLLCTAERWLSPQKDLPDIIIQVDCDPAGFGRVVTPWPLPEELQGRQVLLDVIAKVSYPEGRGALLRVRDGLRVGTKRMTRTRDVLHFLSAFSHFHSGTPARLKMALPQRVSTRTLSTSCSARALWKLGDPAVLESSPVQ